MVNSFVVIVHTVVKLVNTILNVVKEVVIVHFTQMNAIIQNVVTVKHIIEVIKRYWCFHFHCFLSIFQFVLFTFIDFLSPYIF